MANNKHLDTMHSYNNNSNNNNNNNNTKKSNSANSNADANTMTRMHPSMKRPRAPIACYRCHHKKVQFHTYIAISFTNLILKGSL